LYYHTYIVLGNSSEQASDLITHFKIALGTWAQIYYFCMLSMLTFSGTNFFLLKEVKDLHMHSNCSFRHRIPGQKYDMLFKEFITFLPTFEITYY